ncbi:hypothetical protein [Methylocystis bryophila]|uniref:hypothetical protein n=1 Tax=Methylocystis bryophila TaxID=655015 RepID=UPI001319E953|nr:hypothetical protein [Methylocystis bryophila]
MSFPPCERSAQEIKLTANEETRFHKFVYEFLGVVARLEPEFRARRNEASDLAIAGNDDGALIFAILPKDSFFQDRARLCEHEGLFHDVLGLFHQIEIYMPFLARASRWPLPPPRRSPVR